jgi:sulfatase maturation enzyme AslB (radical SAM superfamily)
MEAGEAGGPRISLEDQLVMTSPTLCALPFGHLFLSEEGKSYPCCYALEAGAANLDSAGDPIFVSDRASLDAAWNSPTQKLVRAEMLAGRRPAACERCFRLEDHGLQSLREVSNLRFPEFGDLAGRCSSDGNQPLEFFSLDLRLGNLCNLRCQMCSPVSSRKMVEEFRRLYPGSEDRFAPFSRMTWQESSTLRELILEHSESVREAHFAGGEPFLIPEVEQYVQALAERPGANRIRLSFNTNATLLPERLLSLFPKFEGVRLIISIDGHGPVNDYIRFPSRFSQIEANLKALQGRREEWNLTYVCFNITVQAHNILQLPELIRYLTRSYPGFLPFPVLSPLTVPDCLSAQVLPAEAKELAARGLRRLVESELDFWREIEGRDPNPGGAERFRGHIEGVIAFLSAEDRQSLLPELKRFTAVLEKTRGPAPDIPGL